jgi:hypothetical protein
MHQNETAGVGTVFELAIEVEGLRLPARRTLRLHAGEMRVLSDGLTQAHTRFSAQSMSRRKLIEAPEYVVSEHDIGWAHSTHATNDPLIAMLRASFGFDFAGDWDETASGLQNGWRRSVHPLPPLNPEYTGSPLLHSRTELLEQRRSSHAITVVTEPIN